MAFPLIVALVAIYLGWRSSNAQVIAMGAGLILLMPLASLINTWSYDRMYRRLRLGDADVRLLADAGGLYSSLNDVSSQLAWSSVRRAEELPGQVLLWINPYQASIVPKRALSEPTAVQSFLALASANASAAAP